MNCNSTFFQFMLLRSEAFSHLDVYARYHFVRLLWFHRPIQKRPASVFQLKPSWISLSGYYIQAILLFAMGVKSPPMDVVHNDIWWSCCKPQIPIFCKISWQKILVVQLHTDPSTECAPQSNHLLPRKQSSPPGWPSGTQIVCTGLLFYDSISPTLT